MNRAAILIILFLLLFPALIQNTAALDFSGPITFIDDNGECIQGDGLLLVNSRDGYFYVLKIDKNITLIEYGKDRHILSQLTQLRLKDGQTLRISDPKTNTTIIQVKTFRYSFRRHIEIGGEGAADMQIFVGVMWGATVATLTVFYLYKRKVKVQL